MTCCLLAATLLLGVAPREIVRTLPGGPTLLPGLGLVVTADGTLLEARNLTSQRQLNFGVWQTAQGVIVPWNDGMSDVARAWGKFMPRPAGPTFVHYVAAGVAPASGPQEAGAVFGVDDPKAPYRRIDPAGRVDALAELPTSGPLLGLFALGGEPYKERWALVRERCPRLEIGAVDATGSIVALWAPDWPNAASPNAIYRVPEPGGAPVSLELEYRAGVLLDLTKDRALGVYHQGVSGRWGPCLIDLAERKDLCAGRVWLDGPPWRVPARAVRRADGNWIEFAGLAVNVGNGDSRICWDNPAAWAPSPDGRWSALLDSYRPASPAAWRRPDGPPGASEDWLVVVPAGGESESPLRRPTIRWSAPVSREWTDAWPLGPLPVWSPDSKRVACGGRAYDAEKGTVVGNLEAGAMPLAFRPDGRVIYATHAVKERALVLRLWDPETGVADDLDPADAVPGV